MKEFIAWYCFEPRLALNRSVVLRYGKLFLDSYRRTTNLARMRSYQLPRHRLVLAEGFKLAFRFVGKLCWRDRPK